MNALRLVLLIMVMIAGAAVNAAMAEDGAASERRVALVVGNNSYQNAPSLLNAANDAEDVARALEGRGFEVIHALDLDMSGMRDAVKRFAAAASSADIALFYYSGHGLQWDGENMLVPTDASFADPALVSFELLPVDEVLRALSLARATRILILDACRNNGAEAALKQAAAAAEGKRSATVSRGLAPINASRGQVIVYATQPDATADDGFAGSSRNSPFTHAFLETLEEPGVEVGRFFRRVAARVDELTGGVQLPEISMSLLGDFYFEPPGSEPGAVAPTQSGLSTIAADFAAAERIGTEGAFRAFLNRYGNTGEAFYVTLAREALTRLDMASLDDTAPPANPMETTQRIIAACPHSDTIRQLANFVLVRRGQLAGFGPRAFGTLAVYMLIHYGGPDGPVSKGDIREALEGMKLEHVRGWEEIAFPWIAAQDGIEAAMDFTRTDGKGFGLWSMPVMRAAMLADRGDTILDLFEDDGPDGEAFRTIAHFGLRPAVSIIDQPDALKREIASKAEARGQLVFAGALLISMRDLTAYDAFMDRHGKDELVARVLDDRSINGFGLVGLYTDEPVIGDASGENRSGAVAMEQMFPIIRASLLGSDADFLVTALNMTGRIAELEEVAQAYVAAVEGGFLNPVADPEPGWVFTYEEMVKKLGRQESDETLGSFMFGRNRHYGGNSARDLLDWSMALPPLADMARGLVSDPEKPRLLGDGFDWETGVRVAEALAEGNPDLNLPVFTGNPSLTAELLYRTNDLELLVHFLTTTADSAKSDTELRAMMDVAKDLMTRLDRRCGAFVTLPGQALLLGGAPYYHFDVVQTPIL